MSFNHEEGFEKEDKFHRVLSQALCDCPNLKARTLKRIIAHFAPDFIDGLFEPRPCVRKLKYIGCSCLAGCGDATCNYASEDEFFHTGKLYESIDFNGATYTIKGYINGKKKIGFSYFERVT